MELFTANSLWKNYDRKAIPLKTSIISTKRFNGYIMQSLYFNGEATIDGCTRIYAQYYSLNSSSPSPAVILMNDVQDALDETYVIQLINLGYNVLMVDYVGHVDGRKFTIYPKSLSSGNYFDNPDVVEEIPDDPKHSCWYIWTTDMLRGMTFLQEQENVIADKIAVFGVKFGAFQVYKACLVEPSIKAGISLFNGGYIDGIDLTQDSFVKFNACLDNNTYINNANVPILIQVASNSSDNSIDYMNNLYIASSANKCRFSVSERANDTLGVKQCRNFEYYLAYFLKGEGFLPNEPILSISAKEHKLNYQIQIDESHPVESVELFISESIKNGAYRNWSSLKVQNIDGVYSADADVYFVKDLTYAFANVKYVDGMSVSSEITSKQPYLLGVKPTEIVSSRLIYDADMGLDDWLVLNNTKHTVGLDIKKGSHDILGICSRTNSMSTFKLGDVHFKGSVDNSLQLLFLSLEDQEIVLTVVEDNNDNYNEYTCLRRISGSHDWQKINLSVVNFKSQSGPLEEWSRVVNLSVDSQKTLLINSILWI